MTHRLLGVLA